MDVTLTPHRLFQQKWPEGDYCFFQLGFVVADIRAEAAKWTRVYGVGPFYLSEHVDVPCTYRGVPTAVHMITATAQSGPVQIELIQQVCNRASIYREITQTASVLHQLCTVTPDFEGRTAHYRAQGYDVVTEFRVPGFNVAFFDTFRDFGFFTEVVEQTDSFLVTRGAAAKACEQWDGTDPLRIATPDGYRVPHPFG